MLNDQFMQRTPNQQPQQQSTNGFTSMMGSIVMPRNEPPLARPGGDQGAVSIRRLLLIDTGTYNKQYRRSYNTVYDRNTLDQITERMQGHNRFTPEQVGGLASQFLSPSATTEREVQIENDWDQARCRFVMEVEYRYHGGTIIREFITGGTSHVGVVTSMGTSAKHGSLDNNMRFKINNIVRVRESILRTPTGNQMRRSISEASHLISNNNWNGVFDTPQHETRLRPADAFAIMSRSHLELGGDVFDTRSTSHRTPVKSSRTNGNPAAYLTKMLTGYNHAVVSNANNHADSATILAAARSMVEETSVNDDKFLTAMRAVTGNAMVTDTFTWAELSRFQPGVDNVTEVRLLSNNARAQTHRAGQTKALGGSDHIDVAQAIIAQSVPAVMLNYGVTVMSFHATNGVMGAQHTVAISDLGSLSNDDMSPYGDVIKNELIMYVLQDISFNNELSYDIHVFADVFGTTKIQIRIDNDYGEYVIPSFVDSLMSPVVTADQTRSTTIANDFQTLMDNVIGTNNIVNHSFGSSEPLMPSAPQNRHVEPFRM